MTSAGVMWFESSNYRMWQITGQNKAVSLLQRSLEQGKLSHAYLFVGPHCVGKMTLALELARALNCTGEKPPCGECLPCQKIGAGKHSDVQVIGLGTYGTDDSRTKTEIGIDPIRDLQHSAALPPFEGKCRVYIIDGAEQMSTEAANCLLKTLEEPGKNVLFILLTTNEKLLLETIVSRCQRLELTPLHAVEIEEALINKWQIEPQKALLLSRLCHGCLGWAISAASNDSMIEQRQERLNKLLEIIKAGFDERFAYVSELATQFSRNREAVSVILSLWLDWWHDLMLVKTNLPDAIINTDLMDTLNEMAQGYGLAQIRAAIRAIQSTGEQLKLNANPQLTLEVLMLSIPYKIKNSKKVPLTN